MDDYQKQKLAAMDAINSVNCGVMGQTACAEPSSYRHRSPAEEAEKNAASHFDTAQRLQAGADFLRAHPEFSDFIGLIRRGSIQL